MIEKIDRYYLEIRSIEKLKSKIKLSGKYYLESQCQERELFCIQYQGKFNRTACYIQTMGDGRQ